MFSGENSRYAFYFWISALGIRIHPLGIWIHAFSEIFSWHSRIGIRIHTLEIRICEMEKFWLQNSSNFFWYIFYMVNELETTNLENVLNMDKKSPSLSKCRFHFCSQRLFEIFPWGFESSTKGIESFFPFLVFFSFSFTILWFNSYYKY